MAQAMVNFRMDEELKKNMEATCREMGLSMTAAFTIFATKVTKEKRIPFEVSVDPFYSSENIKRLKRAAREMDEGKGKIHDIVEDNE